MARRITYTAEGELTEAQRQWIEKVWNYAMALTKRHCKRHHGSDWSAHWQEWKSATAWVLTLRARKYNPSRSAPSTYCAMSVRPGRLLHYVNSWLRPMWQAEPEQFDAAANRSPDPGDAAAFAEIAERLHPWTRRHYLDGEPISAIARSEGKANETVSRRIKANIDAIRREFE